MPFTSRVRDESGMTIIELMVAAVICALGIMATIGVMDTSRQTAVKSEWRDVMAHQGERELERLMELPWANLAHGTGAAPTTSPYAGTPSGGSFAWDRKDTTKTAPLVTASTGQVAGTASPWNDNQSRLEGQVHRYVTSISTYSRRVTVVVTAEGTDPPPPLLLSSIKTQPIT
ncbi:MAG: prepilin-type N-terminal cleavage/methylation domain-containing protein [Actinomycetota bacterium]|nr:prepilin-type N-terminal cleavage/methylation domain-containing protein [Actinomycetota bacterium]MDQ5807192.1 prepilin-type N-terminal cleavage/methylation domain-containing protein [Actinomycetota bacterium]